MEASETKFDGEGDQAQKESDMWWASGETKRKQIKRSVVEQCLIITDIE